MIRTNEVRRSGPPVKGDTLPSGEELRLIHPEDLGDGRVEGSLRHAGTFRETAPGSERPAPGHLPGIRPPKAPTQPRAGRPAFLRYGTGLDPAEVEDPTKPVVRPARTRQRAEGTRTSTQFRDDAGNTEHSLEHAPSRASRYLSRSPRYPTSSSIFIRSCCIVSRSRTVTALSSSESKSTVTQYGVPTSS